MSKYYSADYLRGFRTGYSSAYSGDWSTCSDAFEYILKNLSANDINMNFSDGFLDGYECGVKDKKDLKKCKKSSFFEKIKNIINSKTYEELEEEEKQKKPLMEDMGLSGYVVSDGDKGDEGDSWIFPDDILEGDIDETLDDYDE